MMLLNCFVAIAFGVAAVQGKAASTFIQPMDGDTSRPAPWYNCADKQPGNYIHPYDCTRFITCDAGLRAIEFDCGECSNRPEACTPQNRLVYNATVDACLWADETECHDGEQGPTTEGEETTTAVPQPPKAGDPCDPEDCENIGYCQTYLRCDKETEKWVEEQCGDELFWNTKNGAIHGGNCDFLDNLDQEDVDRLRADPECLACFWKATGECEQVYRYQPPNQKNRNVLDLTCSKGLVFSQEKQTCQRCESVLKNDGSSCC